MSTPATPEALHAAWDVMRQRPAFRQWPRDFDQVMADPTRLRLVRLEATHRTRAAQRPVRVQPSNLPLPSAPCTFDFKRAAAGDRDD